MRANEFIIESLKQPHDQGVVEAFDQPYKGKWEKSESDSHDMLVRLPDGTNLSIMFNNEGNDEYQVEFYRNNSQELTGEGDAQRIFATVLNAIQKFVKKRQPWRLIFSASKSVEPGQNPQSRARLYDRLVGRYANDWGYESYSEDHGDQITYEITKKKQGVAENLDNIPIIGINVRDDGDIHYADLIVDGKKKYESRRTNSLNPYIGKTVGIIRTGNRPAVAIGQATIGEPIIVDADKFDKLRNQHLVPKNSKFDIDIDGTKYLYPMINPIRWDVEKPIKHKGIVSRKIQKQGVAEGGAETSWSNDTDTITLQDILELTKHIKQINLLINDNLKSKLLHWEGNPEEIERVNQVTVSNQFPILIMVDNQGQIEWILDGNHRLHKAIQAQAKTIPAKLIKPSDLSDKAKRIFQVKEQGVAEGSISLTGSVLSWPEVVNKINSAMKAMGWKGRRKGDDAYIFSTKGQETDDQWYMVIIDNVGNAHFNYSLGTIEEGDPYIGEKGTLPNTEASISELMMSIREGYGLDEGVAETKVSKYKDLGATNQTTHFIKNVTTGEIVSPHRSLQDAQDALSAHYRRQDGNEYKIVRARKEGVAEASNQPYMFYRGEPILSPDRLKQLQASVGKPYPLLRKAGSAANIGTYMSPDGEKATSFVQQALAGQGKGGVVTKIAVDPGSFQQGDGGIDEAVIITNIAGLVSGKDPDPNDPLRINDRKQAMLHYLGPGVRKYINDPLLNNPKLVQQWYDPEFAKSNWNTIKSGQQAVTKPGESKIQEKMLQMLGPLAEKIRRDPEVIKYFLTHNPGDWVEYNFRMNSDGSGTKVVDVKYYPPAKEQGVAEGL
jgi:predicted transcriptional regulator